MLFDNLCVEFEAAWDAMATSDLAGHTSGRCLFARHVGVCTGTLYLDVRDASEAAGVWRLDADASQYTDRRTQDLTVEDLEAALGDRSGPYMVLFRSTAEQASRD